MMKSCKTDFDDYDNVVFALSDDYELPEEIKGEWISFDIDSKGEFHIGTDSYRWFEWQRAMLDHNSKAFGGWQYSNSDCWYSYPLIKCDVTGNCGISYSKDDIPAIPVKIRFWRVE